MGKEGVGWNRAPRPLHPGWAPQEHVVGAEGDEVDGDLAMKMRELKVMPDVEDVPGVADEVEGLTLASIILDKVPNLAEFLGAEDARVSQS